MIGYHLHNYAAFLATHLNSDPDLLTAVSLFRDVVLPARELFVQRGGGFEPLRHTLQVASRATGGLAASATANGDLEAGRRWAAVGLNWIRRALADPSTRELLNEITEPACRFALLTAPTLLLAIELGIPDTTAADSNEAADLVELARCWEQRYVGDDRNAHSRHAEVVELERRIEKLRGDGPSQDAPQCATLAP